MSAIPDLPFGFSGYPDLPGFDKENRELVYAMCDAGWTVRVTKKNHWLGKAPDGKTTITVPSKNGNNRGLKNAHATYMRWLRTQMSPELVELWDMAKGEDDPLIKETIAEGVVRKHAEEIMHARDERFEKRVKEAIENGEIIVEPLIRPWLARAYSGKDGGTRYESQTTLERVWPDGKTDYACAFEGCDYINDKPRSVAQHYGQQHTRKGEAEPAMAGPFHIDPEYTEPVSSRDYRPTQRMVDTLTELLTTLQGEHLTPGDLAVALLTWMHERPDIEHTERPLVPLTDRQVLDKIRMLVGQPDQSEEIAALKAENLDLANEVARLKDEKAALRDLLTED
jgi:hypothetical protein